MKKVFSFVQIVKARKMREVATMCKKIKVESRTSKKNCEESMEDRKIFCKNGLRSKKIDEE